jgi:colanic acid/amylovoran biosynthesis glycosyltransferase
LDDAALRSAKPVPEAVRLGKRVLARVCGRDAEVEEISADYRRAFRRSQCQAVLVEFGHIAVQALDACRDVGVPMIVHFHGFDVHSRAMLERYGPRYGELFDYAAALVVVSKPMRDALLALGAPDDKTHYAPYGVDLDRFRPGAPDRAPATFIAVGRFVEKKAPQLTILAFAEVRRRHPEVRLRMIGDGILHQSCVDLVRGLGMEDAVEFLGTQPHRVVAEEMQRARAFVQHSIVAADGNSEGMPCAVLEASASALPVVATRHAGIPEIVIDGVTGFIVDEHDVEAMARQMEHLVVDPQHAAGVGRAARQRIEECFSIESSTARLWEVIRTAIGDS